MTGHSFITLLFTGKNSSFRASYPLRYFYVTAHAQYFPVSGFNPIDVFTCDFFIQIVFLVLLRSDYRVHVNAASAGLLQDRLEIHFRDMFLTHI